MMEPVAVSWLVASATSPLVAVLSLWTVYVFHTYRKRWRTVDLFLLAVTSQELIAAIFNFGYAIVSLINPPIPALCSFIHWGIISVRTFQISTLTSMVVDRALTVRWPYRYRFSVRRNQIRYHIAVLALMSILVGVAAVFAHHLQDSRLGVCSTHPKDWDFKFVVFVLGFYGAMVIMSLGCTFHVEFHKCRNGGVHEDKSRPFQLGDGVGPEIAMPPTVTSPLDNDSHTGSTKALHRTYRHSSRRPYGKRAGGGHSDFRWPPVAVVSLVCFSVNHLPYLVLTSLATAMPFLWSPWHEALLSWLRLAEGVLVPLILCLVDQPVRLALKRTFQRRSGALSPLVGDDGPFQMYFDKDHFRKRGTFGSVTPIGIITNYRRTPGKKRRNRKCKYKLPGLQSGDSVIEKSCLSGTFLSTEPLSKLSCADLTALEVWHEEDEENFYATLSDDFSGMSTDDNEADEDVKICEDVYGGSFTTIANDDFEFHDTRPCGGEVKMKPAMTTAVQPNNSFRSSIKSAALRKEKAALEEVLKSKTNEKFAELMSITFDTDPDKLKDPDLFDTGGTIVDAEPDLIKTDDENDYRSPTSLSKATSFSMNDLDLIDKNDAQEQEKVVVLPVKSESTMSLYRLSLNHDLLDPPLPSARSESNVTGSTESNSTNNPIWPGYPTQRIADRGYRNNPSVLHPRMQKIPWISAWRKLGGNVESQELKKSRKPKDVDDALKEEESALRMMLITDNFELRPREGFQWKDSVIYGSDNTDQNLQGVPINDPLNMSEQYTYGLSPYSEMDSHLHPNQLVLVESQPKAKASSRKRSFKTSAPKPPIKENPYGRIKDAKLNPATEENIYEEINKAKKGNESRDPPPAVENKFYAQTNILELMNANTHANDAKLNDFRLNINVNQMQPDSAEDTPQNISNLVINCTPLNDPKLVEHRDKMQDNFNYNNRVHVAYNVNDSMLEFIDKSEENVYQPIPYDHLGDADLNANCSQTFPIENQNRGYDLRFYNHGVTSALCKKESKKPHYKDIKRRDSKKGRPEDNYYRKIENFSVVRRDSDRKAKDLKRRESGSRNKRENNLSRRESDSRNKRSRNSSIPDDKLPQRRNDLNHLQKSEHYDKTTWAKELIQETDDLRKGGLKTCIQVDDSVLQSPPTAYGDIEKGFHLSNGVIRLHCNYPNENTRAYGVDPRSHYVELCRDDSVREKRSEVSKRQNVERKHSDNKVRRKSSNRTKHRESGVEKKDSFEGDGRTYRSPEFVKHIRRTNSFQEPNANYNDVNYNESTKANADRPADEHTRMDNLVYGGRRNNGNFAPDVEVYPFETFAKPPSYNNLMKHHAQEYRDRCKQRKVAITDYL